jgi:hypothetical protein
LRTWALVAVAALPRFAAAQSVAIANGPFLLSPGDTVEILLKVSPAAGQPPLTASPTIEDFTTDGVLKLQQAGSPKKAGSSSAAMFWTTQWTVAGMHPGVNESHVLLVTVGAWSDVAPVQISYRQPFDPQFTVPAPPAPLRLVNGRASAARLAGNGGLTGVKAAVSTLVEDKSGEPLPVDQIELSDSEAGAAAGPGGLTVRSSDTVFLRVSANFSSPGKFVGNVLLDSNDKKAFVTIPWTVYSTSPGRQLAGALLLLAGLLVYYVTAITWKARSRRAVALLPITRVREQLELLTTVATRVQTTTGHVFGVLLSPVGNQNPGSLLYARDQMSDTNVPNLPSKWPNPFSPPDMSMQLQTYLSQMGNRVATYNLVVRWGLVAVESMWGQVAATGVQAQGNAALTALDNLATFGGPPDMLRNSIQTQLTNLQTAITNAMALAGGGGAPRPVAYTAPSSQQLTVQIERLSLLAWVVWGVLTIAVGCVSLVLFNAGFGTAQDLVTCFLWGAGMPGLVQGLGGLTMGSVASAFSLQLAH